MSRVANVDITGSTTFYAVDLEDDDNEYTVQADFTAVNDWTEYTFFKNGEELDDDEITEVLREAVENIGE